MNEPGLDPHRETIVEELKDLCRRDAGEAFSIFEDVGTRKFVQFAGGAGESLKLDLPSMQFKDLDDVRAQNFFARLPQPCERYDIGSPGSEDLDHAYLVDFGSDVESAADAALGVLHEVFLIPVAVRDGGRAGLRRLLRRFSEVKADAILARVESSRTTPRASGKMSVTIRAVRADHPGFAGEVSGVDIAAGVSAEDAAIIEAGMDEYAVLVFRDQQLDDDQQYAFSQHFGPMEKATGDIQTAEQRRLSMDINDISNLDQHGRVMARDDRRRLFGLGNMLWHSDSSFKPTPAKFSILSGRAVPEAGGNTEFADMRAAWDTLDEETRQECLDKVCDHSQLYSRGLLGFTDWSQDELDKNQPVPQRLVRKHPNTGRLSLYLSSHAGAIHGWPMPEARMFLRDLMEHATQRDFVYSHRWRQWDLVMWDNRVVMHRARRVDRTKVRDMHRTTVSDRAPTLEQPI